MAQTSDLSGRLLRWSVFAVHSSRLSLLTCLCGLAATLVLALAAYGPSTSGHNNQITTASEATGAVVSRLPRSGFYDWFRSVSWGNPDPRYAAPYALMPVDDALYMAFSASVPVHQHNGPVFARYTRSDGLEYIAAIDEQDSNRIKRLDDLLLLPGYDPANGDGWNAGNFYIYDTGADTFEKLRYARPQPHFIRATITDENGAYRFEHLPPSSYYLRFIAPAGQRWTRRNASGRSALDSAADADGWTTHCTTLESAPSFERSSSESNINAGLIAAPGAAAAQPHPAQTPDPAYTVTDPDAPHFSLSGAVWADADADGMRNNNEAAAAGVRVELYTRDPYFPCMLHGNGLYADPQTDTIYYEGARTSPTRFYISQDRGATWQAGPLVDQRWAQDLTRHNGYFYRLVQLRGVAAQPVTSYVMYSADLIEWAYLGRPLADAVPDDFAHIPDATNSLLTFQDALIVLHTSGRYLYRITQAGDYDLIALDAPLFGPLLPGFVPEPLRQDMSAADLSISNRYNTLANANDDLLYGIGADNRIYASTDLHHWQPIADFNAVDAAAPAVTLSYWPAQNALIVATAGADAALYRIDHAAVKNDLVQ